MAATSPEKKEAIKRTLKETRERRKTQSCKVYELKINKSRCNRSTLKALGLLFLEAKWLCNAILGSDDLFGFDTSVREVVVKVGESWETRPLTILGSQVKQSIHSQMKAEIKGLTTKKKQGRKVGKLKFKSRVTSVELKQCGITYQVTPNGRLKLQNIHQTLRVRGMKQIPPCAEFANARLVHRHGDFYLHLTCFMTPAQLQAHQEKKRKRPEPEKMEAIGMDVGIAHQVTLSNGIRVDYRVPVSPSIRKCHRRVSKKKDRSKNKHKAKVRLQKGYAKTTNIKQDIIHKLVAVFCMFAKYVCVQDDYVKAWQRIWGKRILETSIGGLLGKLKQLPYTLVVPRFYASTQECSCCHLSPTSRLLCEKKTIMLTSE
jgi:transposase